MSDIGILEVASVLAVIGVYVLITALAIALVRFIGSRWRRADDGQRNVEHR
jgi:hypothetical protein